MDWMTIVGDAAWILALGLMASASFQASKVIPPGVKVPVYFNRNGLPARRGSKASALLLNLGLGLVAAIFLRMGAHKTAGMSGSLILTLLSIALAPVLAYAHLSNLDRALKALEAEGVLRR